MSGPTKRDRRLLKSVISSPVLGPVTRNQGKAQARPRAVALAAAVPGTTSPKGTTENHTILDGTRQTRDAHCRKSRTQGLYSERRTNPSLRRGPHKERIGSNDAIDQETPHLRYQRGP